MIVSLYNILIKYNERLANPKININNSIANILQVGSMHVDFMA
jgi:hypothetical protein